jgi:hypothetical protein
MMVGSFGVDGQPVFYVAQSKTRDYTRLQSAMFTDRPDLWRKPPARRRRRVPPEQQPLFEGIE